ncbi:MAG: acyltransferase [Pirellulaceae bacterium]
MSANNIDSSQSPAPKVWQLGKHIPQLDGVRGLAILIVTLYRFSKEFPTDSLVGKIMHLGFTLGDRGVELFFVLSGFLITGILVDAKGQQHFFKNFLARRSLRIFPLYFTALFLFVIVFNWLNPSRPMFDLAQQNQFYLWTYLTNVKMSFANDWCFGYLDHFWSLAVEEHFYLVWPFVLFLCSQRTALRVACCGAALSAVARILYAKSGESAVAPDVLTIFRCDALLIGAAIALQIRTPNGLQPIKRATYVIFPACLAVGLAFAVADKRAYTISHTLWPLIWACVLVWLLTASQRHLLAHLFNLALLRKLGKFSYAMYVFQSPLIPLTAGVLSASALSSLVGNNMAGHLLYIAAMSSLTYAAAVLSWYALESHCLKLKEWFPSHQSATAPHLEPSEKMVSPLRAQ